LWMPLSWKRNNNHTWLYLSSPSAVCAGALPYSSLSLAGAAAATAPCRGQPFFFTNTDSTAKRVCVKHREGPAVPAAPRLTVAHWLQADAFDEEARGCEHGGQRRHARVLLLPPLQALGSTGFEWPLAVVYSLASWGQQRLLLKLSMGRGGGGQGLGGKGRANRCRHARAPDGLCGINGDLERLLHGSNLRSRDAQHAGHVGLHALQLLARVMQGSQPARG
jgi:hypothetical protein